MQSNYQPRNAGSGTGLTQPEFDSLEKAARQGQDQLLQDLLQNKAVHQRQLNMALHAAVEGCNSTLSVESHVACIYLLLDSGA